VKHLFGNNYGPRQVGGQWQVWLIEYGWSPAVRGGDLRPGDVLRCNYGAKEPVLVIERETAATVWLTVEDQGKVYRGIRKAKTALVAVASAQALGGEVKALRPVKCGGCGYTGFCVCKRETVPAEVAQ